MEQKAPHSPPGGARKRRPSYAASSRARPLLRKRSSAVEMSSAPSSARSAPSRESVVVDSADDTGANKKPRPPLGAYNLFFRHERNNIMNGTTSSLTSSVLSGKGCSSEQLLRDIMSDDGSATGTTSTTFANPSSGRGAGGAKCHAELTKLVSSRWRALDAPSRAIYDGLALLERKKYERAMERWVEEEERRRRQRQEEFLSSSSQSGEDSIGGSDDDGEGNNKNSKRQIQGDDQAEKWRRAIARLPRPSTKSATDTASYMRCKSIIDKGTNAPPNIRSQTLISEPPGEALHAEKTPSSSTSRTSSSSISALRTSILERKRQLQRDAEREYHRLARAEKASSSSRKLTSRASKAGRDRLPSLPANTNTVSSGSGKVPPGEESSPVDEAADNDRRTERDAAATILEAIPSDAEDGDEQDAAAAGVVVVDDDDFRRRRCRSDDDDDDDDDDTLRLLTEAFAAEDNNDDQQRSGSSATVSAAAAAGARRGKEEKDEDDDDDNDDESRMHARLYDPIPVAAGAAAHTRGNDPTAPAAAAAAASSMSSAGSHRAHSNGMHDDSAVPSSSSLLLHSSSSAISNLTGTGTESAAAALTSGAELFRANDTAARSAPGSSSRANDEDELDGESVRFLASIFGARSA